MAGVDVKVPFHDLRVAPERRRELLVAIDRVFEHGQLILGPEVAELERSIAKLCEVRHCVGVSSGSDALLLALRALDIGPGDEVITTPLSWIATFNAIVLTGATPVWIDVRPDLTIDPDRIESAVTAKTKAILPVHFTGRVCRMPQIAEIARRHDIAIVEDAAQAFGARLDGRPAGSFGTLAAFSMNCMKVFNAYGEAGAVATDRDDLADRIRALRINGCREYENAHWPSLNHRLDTIQAAMLLVNLRTIQDKIQRYREIANRYSERLRDVVLCPDDSERHFDIYYQYHVLTPRRDEVLQHLQSRGIEARVKHRLLMPQHEAYRGLTSRFRCPNAERIVRDHLCLPVHESLTDAQVEFVCDEVHGVFQK